MSAPASASASLSVYEINPHHPLRISLSTPVENVTVMAVENVTLWGEVTSL